MTRSNHTPLLFCRRGGERECAERGARGEGHSVEWRPANPAITTRMARHIICPRALFSRHGFMPTEGLSQSRCPDSTNRDERRRPRFERNAAVL